MIGRVVLLILAAAAPAAARDTLGIYKSWGAFRDATPARCYAIARPVMAGGRSGGFASIANWPQRGLRGSLHIHLSRERDRSAGVDRKSTRLNSSHSQQPRMPSSA